MASQFVNLTPMTRSDMRKLHRLEAFARDVMRDAALRPRGPSLVSVAVDAISATVIALLWDEAGAPIGRRLRRPMGCTVW